jgi:copper transport protein
VGVALAASGHASSAEPQLLTRPAVFVHGIVVAFWIGALVPLAAVMRSPDRRAVELARFSRAIPTAIILLIASGISLAIVQLRQVDALWTTGYGLVLCGKLIAVVALLSLAALNRFALTPRVVAGDSIAARRITRSIAAELSIAVLALAFVAAWRFTPPPRALLAAAEAPVHVHIHSDKAGDPGARQARGRYRAVAPAGHPCREHYLADRSCGPADAGRLARARRNSCQRL